MVAQSPALQIRFRIYAVGKMTFVIAAGYE